MISQLNDQDLIAGVKRLVGEEKKILQSILEYLSEIETRRLYSLRGYPSLFEFCVKELGYSEGSTQRRISAMRLMRTLPEAKGRFESGVVNLSTLSQLQSFIRKEEVGKSKRLEHGEKLELLNIIENKSQKECEREFVKLNPGYAKSETLRPLTSELFEMRLTVSKEFEAKLKELKNLLSHQNKSSSLAELLEITADMALKQLKKKTSAAAARTTENPNTAAAAVKKPKVSLEAIKRFVYARDQGECQYVDPLTKRKCQSRHKIQFEHAYPKGLGGSDTAENLQLLCQQHNLLRATQTYSKKYMERFLRK